MPVWLRCRPCGTVLFRGRRRLSTCHRCGATALDAVGIAALIEETCSTRDEYTAAELLFHLRFGEDWGCERCGHRQCTHLRSRPRVFECNSCGTPTSVTSGTSLHRCRLPLGVVLRAAHLLSGSSRSISSRALARTLGVGLETAWTLAHRLRTGFREALGPRLGPDVVLSPVNVRSRPPWRKRQVGLFSVAALRVLWDQSHQVVVITGKTDPSGLRRFVDRHSDVERPFCGPYLLPDSPWVAVNQTHRGVSERWLPLYAHAMAGWHNARTRGEPATVATLRSALRSGHHPFRRLRPRAPPGPHFRWEPSFEELEDHYEAWKKC